MVMHDWSEVPRGKRGLSIAYVSQDNKHDGNWARTVRDSGPDTHAGGSRSLDYLEYHVYPELNNETHPSSVSIKNSYDILKGLFPNTTVLIGEFGARENENPAEFDKWVLDIAQANNIPYHLHWLLWKDSFAWGDRDAPKSQIGTFSTASSLIANADMEAISNGTPLDWFLQSMGTPSSLTYGGAPYAATNSIYARVQTTSAQNGTIGIYAMPAAVPSGAQRMFLNSYIRSNCENVRMGVDEYDANWNFIGSQSGPSFTPGNWAWKNYLYNAGSWSPVLKSNTSAVVVWIKGNAQSTPAYLDFDTVSAYAPVPQY